MWQPHWLTEPQIAALLHTAEVDGDPLSARDHTLLTEIVGKARTACNPPGSSPGRQGEVLSRLACWRGARGLTVRGRISYPQT